MKTSIVRIATLLVVAFLATATPARAQLRNPIRFNAPVAFWAGHRFLPAGGYVLEPLPTRFDAFLLSNSDTQQPIAFLSADTLGAAPNPKAKYDQVMLAMDQRDNHYVLCQVWDAYDRQGVQLSGTFPVTRAAMGEQRGHVTVKTIIVRSTPQR